MLRFGVPKHTPTPLAAPRQPFRPRVSLTRLPLAINIAPMDIPPARLVQAASNPRQLARKAMTHRAWLAALKTGLESDQPRVKYGCAKALRHLSEERPALLYPHFEFFRRLLDHQNKILQWEAAFVLSQLARVDTSDKFAAIFKKYFSPIRGPVMITAALVIQGGARIAWAKPHLADRIATEIRRVGRASYQTRECRNVAIGHAIVALGEMFPLLRHRRPVLQFVRRQVNNSRAATSKKAERFLKRVQTLAKEPQT